MGETKKRLAIIDGKSVFYRGYYAMPNLTTKDGTPTGGVFGFAVMALEVIKRLKPDYVCVAWDKPKTNIRKRKEIYPEYKANRKPAPPDFYVQIPMLHELLDAFGWPLYELDDYEADDIMGTLAVQARKKGVDTALITSDLDMLQVINGNVHVYALKKGLSNIELFHPESFEAKYGLKTEQFLDWKSLRGDSSDNIPGVPGIGEKTATELLKKYKTLDEIYENIELIPEKTAKKLKAGKELAYLSKKLAAIWLDAPLKLNLNDIDGSQIDGQKIQQILQKFEFRTLARQIPDILKVDLHSHDDANSNFSYRKLSGLDIISTAAELDKVKLPSGGKSDPPLFVYSRSAGAHGRRPQWLFVGAEGAKKIFALDLTKLPSAKTIALLKDAKLVGYDVKTSLEILLEVGIKELPKIEHDVLIGAFLLNSLRRDQALTQLAQSELGYDGQEFDNLSDDELMHRAPEIISIIQALYAKQKGELAKLPKLQKLAQTIEWPVTSVLARMEHKGIVLNKNYLAKFEEELKDQISDVEQQIYGYGNEEFNISSPQQLAHMLFDKLDLPKQGVKKGKTGFSTAAKELDKLRDKHPIINLISEYREMTKLLNTYVQTLPKMADENNRIHTTFSMAIAPTGRLSSSDPNLQNIPVRTDLGKRIRTAFEAEKGKLLISADYSQFELRLASVLAGDKELVEMFNKDVDVHTATAAQIYGRDPEDVTKNMRREAKVVNFGIMYGLSPHGLSVAAGISREAAKNFIDKYFEIRPKLLKYIASIKEKATKEGYVETLFGRRRPTPDIHSTNFAVREAALRAAVNMPFQGTAADIMKLGMIHAEKYLDKIEGADMLLQIHDSILVEAPVNQADEIARELKDIMENVYKLPVKLTVDTAIGKNWGEL